MAMFSLNPTEVIRYIKRNIGDVVYDIEAEISDEEMMKTVFQESLVTFSKYFPFKFRVGLREKDEIIRGKNVYTIPNVDGLRIVGVSEVYLSDLNSYNNLALMNSTDPVNNQLYADFQSYTQTRITPVFIPPNKVEIFPKLWSSSYALAMIMAVHPEHLSTIDTGLREHFLQLCLLDFLVTLFPIRKRFENIESPYGNISLFLDQVENAKAEREALIEKFAQNSILTYSRKIKGA